MSLALAEAQQQRRARGELVADEWIEYRLDVVGLSEDAIALGTADVSPAARHKLKGIIDALRRDPHPFTRCMKNLREEQPGWTDDRRKKTCNVLKALAGRQNGGRSAGVNASADGDACVALDVDVVELLGMIDDEALASLMAADAALAEGEQFAVMTAKKRKKLPTKDFVFPGQKRYPIHDRQHGANALARAKGTPEEPKVKAAVCARYSDLPACQEGGS